MIDDPRTRVVDGVVRLVATAPAYITGVVDPLLDRMLAPLATA